MLKRTRILISVLVCLVFFINLSFLPNLSDTDYVSNNDLQNLNYSTNVEGIDNILVTDIDRIANISGFGMVTIKDYISIKNLNNNPITSMLVAIPLNYSENLIYYEASGSDGNSLLAERSHLIMNEFEMITIYFDSPLLPQQTKRIKFIQQFTDLLVYYIIGEHQFIRYNGYVYPTLPYKSERDMNAQFHLPIRSGNIEGGWGFEQPDLLFVKYDILYIKDVVEGPFIEPFLENLNENKIITISFYQDEVAPLKFEEINREIFISPWGVIKVTDEYTIKNYGPIPNQYIFLHLPKTARKVYVSDAIGEILGLRITGKADNKELRINLLENRVRLLSNSSFSFKVSYYLPFENYFSINWLQESIEIDLYTTSFEYFGKDLTIKLVIDGCYSLDYITINPEAVKKSYGSMSLIFTADSISSAETKAIQFTFTIDLFDLLLKPLLYMVFISLIASAYVFIIKTRKKEYGKEILKREFIPINEIREFCALYEERNALILELRQAEVNAKRRKIAKKNYKNILNKNTAKADEIQKEIAPFKKILMETSETFENIVKRLDVLDAERISVKDSLNLLESRYKTGRLPSRAAYMKLSDDFVKRRKKIDRTIDRFLQQLRSYLL